MCFPIRRLYDSRAVIPVRDINPRLRWPGINYALMVAIVGVFLKEVALDSEGLRLLFEAYAPTASAWHAVREGGGWQELSSVAVQMMSSAFLHGGWFHVIGNLMYLRVFGDNVEDRLGHVPYLLFYLGAAWVSAACQLTTMSPQSEVPLIGASGAISAVLGFYLICFPKAKVVTLVPVFVFLTFIDVPAILFLGVYLAQQLLNWQLSLGAETQGGIAWMAHLGGFAFGALVAVVHLGHRWVRRKSRR